MTRPDNTIRIEEARLIFRNFTGRPGKYNGPGDRSFCVVLDETMARVLTEDGWNVKWLDPREDAEEGTEPTAFLSVNVKYSGRYPPRVSMITSRGLTELKEDEVEILDQVQIRSADMKIRPYPWENAKGEKGLSAYVQSIFVIVEEDELDLKYADLPRSRE